VCCNPPSGTSRIITVSDLYILYRLDANYTFTADNYESSGFSPRFTAIEYVLGVATEWLAYAVYPVLTTNLLTFC